MGNGLGGGRRGVCLALPPGAAHAVASQEAVEGGGLPRPARALEGGTCCSCMPALPPAPHRSSESRCDPILPLGHASAPQDPARLPHPCSSLRFCLSLLSPVPHTPGGRCQKPELPGSGNVSPRSPPHTPPQPRPRTEVANRGRHRGHGAEESTFHAPSSDGTKLEFAHCNSNKVPSRLGMTKRYF